MTDDMLALSLQIIGVFNLKYPGHQLLCLFDHSSNHKAFDADALRSTKVAMGWGGKQPILNKSEG